MLHSSFILKVQFCTPFFERGMKLSEEKLKKRLEFRQKIISRQSEQIDGLKKEIEELKLIIEEKDKTIKSVEPLRKELADNINDIKQQRKKYEALVKELKTMKNIINEDVYKKRWWLVKYFLK